MSDEHFTQPSPPRSRHGCLLAGTLVVLSIVTLVVVIGAVLRAPTTLIREAIRKEESQIDITAVVDEVRALSRLETAAMRTTHISTISQSYGVIPDVLAGDELTLVAVGEVIAGVDLSEIESDDVWVEEDVLVLRLPSPRILVSRLDNDETRVIHRETGILRKGDVQMEGRARATAERGIRKEALQAGILDDAAENARVKLAAFLHTLGVRKIRFEQSEIVNPFAKH